LKAIYFPMTGTRSCTTSVCTIIPSKESARNPRFPSVEAILGSQHQIYSCYVSVNVTGLQHGETFLVFFQFAATLPINDSLEASFPDLEWRGGILTMRVGQMRQVTGLRNGRVQRLAQLAIQRYVQVRPNLYHIDGGSPVL
ncbi:hypothetical protein DFJ58DRAFT_656553, partial [Suillus subalutaceus]|uniref:uncharacterized protein n=1 Tax=Suillus subalutaceus TaxID=48586 RepID=UPI001B878841